jgi:hypothetical protein
MDKKKTKRRHKKDSSSEEDEEISSANEEDLNKLRNPKFRRLYAKIPSNASEEQLKFILYFIIFC